MTKWNKLLQAPNQTFNSQTGATSNVKTVQRAFDKITQEHVIWLEYRGKADVFESEDFDDQPTDHSTSNSVKRKRLIDVITEATLRAAL